MRKFKRFCVYGVLVWTGLTSAYADYAKGTTMFQIYGGGAALGGRYRQPGVVDDDQEMADGGGVIGGQFLYFTSESLAVGFDISHADFDDHESSHLLTNRFTKSSADNTTGLAIVRLSYPKGHVRPYIEGGLGVHHTGLNLEGTPINGTTWSDTGTTENRTLLDDGQIGLALEGAVGTHIFFTERVFVGIELKILALAGKEFEPTSAGVHEGLLSPRRGTSEAVLGLMLGLGF